MEDLIAKFLEYGPLGLGWPLLIYVYLDNRKREAALAAAHEKLTQQVLKAFGESTAAISILSERIRPQ